MGNAASRQLASSGSLKRTTSQDSDGGGVDERHHHRNKCAAVSLSGKQLRELPDAFLESSREATFIDLSKNWLRSLPEGLGAADKLEKLALGDNLLTSLPSDIGRLKRLRWLDLTHNMLAELPESMAGCGELIALGLSEASFRTFPQVICQLGKLRCVGLFNNAIVGVPREIGQLALLEKLDLSGNHIHSLPEEIKRLTRLHWLNLSNNQLVHVPDLSDLTVLEELGLSNNHLRRLPDLSRCGRLRVLSAFANDISHLDDWIEGCQSLVKLDLSQNRLTSVPVHTFALPHLDFLNLKDNPLSEIGTRARLGRCLHKLDLQNCSLKGIPAGLLDRHAAHVDIRVAGNPFAGPGAVLLADPPFALPRLQAMLVMECLRDGGTCIPSHLAPPSLILSIVVCAVCCRPFTWPEILLAEQRVGADGAEMAVLHPVCSPHCMRLHKSWLQQ